MARKKRIKKICPICKNKFEVPVYCNYIKHCSVKCGRISQKIKMLGNTFGFKKGHKLNIGRKQTDESKKKISQSVKDQYKNGIRDKYKITQKANEKTRELSKQGNQVLQRWHRTHPSPLLGRTKANGLYPEHIGFKKGKDNVINKYPEKHPNYIMAQKGHKSQPEKIFESLLIENKIEYEFQKRIGTYWTDFYLPKYNLIIECDGHHWHKKDDVKRDLFIQKEGYKILHWKIFKYNKNNLTKEANEIMENIRMERITCYICEICKGCFKHNVCKNKKCKGSFNRTCEDTKRKHRTGIK